MKSLSTPTRFTVKRHVDVQPISEWRYRDCGSHWLYTVPLQSVDGVTAVKKLGDNPLSIRPEQLALTSASWIDGDSFDWWRYLCQ